MACSLIYSRRWEFRQLQQAESATEVHEFSTHTVYVHAEVLPVACFPFSFTCHITGIEWLRV